MSLENSKFERLKIFECSKNSGFEIGFAWTFKKNFEHLKIVKQEKCGAKNHDYENKQKYKPIYGYQNRHE